VECGAQAAQTRESLTEYVDARDGSHAETRLAGKIREGRRFGNTSTKGD